MPRITGAATLGFAHYTLYEALPRLAKIGFKKIEITSFDTYCFHFNYGSPTPEELRTMLDDLHLEAVSMNYSAAAFYDAWDAREIDKFAQFWHRKIKQLPAVGIKMMTMRFGRRNGRPDRREQLAHAALAYSKVGDIAKEYGVKMLLEIPHLYGIAHGTEQALEVVGNLRSDNVGVLIDSSHWGIIGYDMDEFISALGDKLWHIHLRDSRGADTADFKQELELTPGKGTVDFAGLARILDKTGYRGEVMLDFEYRDMALDEIEREYHDGLRYLQRCGWTLPEGMTGQWSKEDRG